MNKKLKAEIWEIQVILYWILSLLLFQYHHPILGWAVLVWSVISFIGMFVLLIQAKIEERKSID